MKSQFLLVDIAAYFTELYNWVLNVLKFRAILNKLMYPGSFKPGNEKVTWSNVLVHEVSDILTSLYTSLDWSYFSSLSWDEEDCGNNSYRLYTYVDVLITLRMLNDCYGFTSICRNSSLIVFTEVPYTFCWCERHSSHPSSRNAAIYRIGLAIETSNHRSMRWTMQIENMLVVVMWLS